MQVASEIEQIVKNLRYYSNQIKKKAREQSELDFKHGEQTGMNSSPGSIRFDCLGNIIVACEWLDIYCDNIMANLQSATNQDKVLYSEEVR